VADWIAQEIEVAYLQPTERTNGRIEAAMDTVMDAITNLQVTAVTTEDKRGFMRAIAQQLANDNNEPTLLIAAPIENEISGYTNTTPYVVLESVANPREKVNCLERFEPAPKESVP
jgi:hypothetical protein